MVICGENLVMRNISLTLLFFTAISLSSLAQNVGIGTSSPNYNLDVIGTIHTTSSLYAGSIGIGTFGPVDKLHLVNGNIRITTGMIQLDAAGVDKGFIQLSANDLRIGTNASNITGSFIVRTNGGDRLKVDPNGDVTVNGKGIVYNAASAKNLRIYSVPATFSVTLAAHASTTSHIGFVGFSGTPIAYVANIVSNGGTSGELYRCILQLYNVTPTGCDCKIINTDNTAIDQNITWNVVCIGN
jgi:hypothetical protein